MTNYILVRAICMHFNTLIYNNILHMFTVYRLYRLSVEDIRVNMARALGAHCLFSACSCNFVYRESFLEL